MKVKYKTHHPEVIFILLLTFLSCRSTENLYIKENYKNLNTVNTFEQNFLESNKLGIIYRNPRVYNVDYSFELCPDPAKIDRSKDLKLWVPVPSEWDSQKAVKIISVQPPPHAEYEDPEHGNRMLFWDFGKDSEKPSYRVDIKFRLESYEVNAEVDPENIRPYDKTSNEYALYTRSTHTISITPKIQEMAQLAVGDEKNPYRQAEELFQFVGRKVRYKMHYMERGVGTEVLLAHPLRDDKTGEEYYEGGCSQQHRLFIALCRAVGIPARGVTGFVGWNPGIKKEDLNLFLPIEKNLSPEGLAATQHYLAINSHGWAEFYLEGYGWVPVDITNRIFGELEKRFITGKGYDVQIGPHDPDEDNEGYGFQWVLLHNGTTQELATGIWNIAKIRIAKFTMLHQSDPFPADGLASYPLAHFPKADAEKELRHWRQGVLNWPSHYTRGSIPDSLNLEQFYNDGPELRENLDALICHMLRRQLGDENFSKLVDKYIDIRQTSNLPVPTTRFRKLAEDIYGESLDWFFNQWINSTELPRLKLEKVMAKKNQKSWQVHGQFLQSGNTIFRLPVDLAIDTEHGREIKKLLSDKRTVYFDFNTQNEPQKLIVDPDYEILKIQRMPPHLVWFWDDYPNYVLIYGTSIEAEANKIAAERFQEDYLGSLSDIIKADTEVNQDDLKNKCIILFGRPATNKIYQQFGDIFPIKFDHNKFAWQGITYDQPTQGVAQIVENPLEPGNNIILYYGLSSDAKKLNWQSYTMNANASYVIFNQAKKLVSGDWEEADADLVWTFE